MSETPFQKVMGLLGQLSQAELATVVFHAQQVSVKRQQRPGPGLSRPGPKTQAKPGPKAAKGPDNRVSKWADVPAYASFKEAERKLHALLKERKTTLSGLQKDEPKNLVLVSFEEARNLWFREKEQRKAKPSESSAPAAAKPYAEEKKQEKH